MKNLRARGYKILDSDSPGVLKTTVTGFRIKESKAKGTFKFLLGVGIVSYTGAPIWTAIGWLIFDTLGGYVEGKQYYIERQEG